MKVIVKLFAGARELAGQEQIALELAPDTTIVELRRQLIAECPALSPLVAHAVFAIDANYVTDDCPVKDGAEIACIPPVSGG